MKVYVVSITSGQDEEAVEYIHKKAFLEEDAAGLLAGKINGLYQKTQKLRERTRIMKNAEGAPVTFNSEEKWSSFLERKRAHFSQVPDIVALCEEVVALRQELNFLPSFILRSDIDSSAYTIQDCIEYLRADVVELKVEG